MPREGRRKSKRVLRLRAVDFTIAYETDLAVGRDLVKSGDSEDTVEREKE